MKFLRMKVALKKVANVHIFQYENGANYPAMFGMFIALNAVSKKYKDEQITKEEYDAWRYNYSKPLVAETSAGLEAHRKGESIEDATSSSLWVKIPTNLDFSQEVRVRRAKGKWQKVYYDFFENNKHRQDISFQEILYYLYKHTGQIEHSFSSKMLSTINPTYAYLGCLCF